MIDMIIFRVIKDSSLSVFTEKGYGMELMVLLARNARIEPGKGIDEVYELIESCKPQKLAYTNYLRRLERRGVVSFQPCPQKKTKRMPTLSPKALRAYDRLAAQLSDGSGRIEQVDGKPSGRGSAVAKEVHPHV